jgi:hypothetical protein
MFLGKATISDTIALLAAKERDVNALADAFKAFHAEWARKDGAAMANWLTDWGGFWNRWKNASAYAKSEVFASKANPTPNDRLPSASYNGLLRALTRTQGQVQKGDFQDLYARLARAGARVDTSDAPQPSTHDLDRDLFNTLDKVTHKIEKVPVLGPVAAAAADELGIGRNKADGPTDEDKAKAKWTFLGIGAAIVAGILVLLRIEK